MVDESGPDPKILAVPVNKLTPFFRKVENYSDISEDRRAVIVHFFEHYKDLEEGKWVEIDGWSGVNEAKQEIIKSIERYNSLEKKPNF
jgi:inorganic pyrophosphatase